MKRRSTVVILSAGVGHEQEIQLLRLKLNVRLFVLLLSAYGYTSVGSRDKKHALSEMITRPCPQHGA